MLGETTFKSLCADMATKRASNVAMSVIGPNGDTKIVLTYHNTEVATIYTFSNGRTTVLLNTGGYETRTTYDRMNSALRCAGIMRYKVCRHNFRTCVNIGKGQYVLVCDGRTYVQEDSNGLTVDVL